jgi:hypothetical protein
VKIQLLIRQLSLFLFCISLALLVLAPSILPISNQFSKINVELELGGEEEGESSKKESEVKTFTVASNLLLKQSNQLCSIAFHEHIFSEGMTHFEVITPPPEFS